MKESGCCTGLILSYRVVLRQHLCIVMNLVDPVFSENTSRTQFPCIVNKHHIGENISRI